MRGKCAWGKTNTITKIASQQTKDMDIWDRETCESDNNQKAKTAQTKAYPVCIRVRVCKYLCFIACEFKHGITQFPQPYACVYVHGTLKCLGESKESKVG